MSGEQTMGGNARVYPNIDAFCEGLRDNLRQVADAFTPPEAAMGHFRQSRVEFLMGVRELLNHRIDRMSRGKNAGASVVVE
jgi:hypothetical protein